MRLEIGGAQRVDGRAVGRDLYVGVGEVVVGQPDHVTGGDVDAEHRRATVLVGDQHQRGAVGRPAHGARRPVVPRRGEVTDLTAGHVGDSQDLVAGVFRSGALLVHDSDLRAVGTDPRPPELVVPVVCQDPPFPGLDVHDRQRLPQATWLEDVPLRGDHASVAAHVVLGQAERRTDVPGQVAQLHRRLGAPHRECRRRASAPPGPGRGPSSGPGSARAGSPTPSCPCAPFASSPPTPRRRSWGTSRSRAARCRRLPRPRHRPPRLAWRRPAPRPRPPGAARASAPRRRPWPPGRDARSRTAGTRRAGRRRRSHPWRSGSAAWPVAHRRGRPPTAR